MRVILRNSFELSRHIEADALIDTGASCICISNRIAKELGLTRTGETRMIAVGADHPAVEFAAQLKSRASMWNRERDAWNPSSFVIPGQCEALNPEPRSSRRGVGPWVPGSSLRDAPE